MKIKKYILSLLLVGSLASLALAPSAKAKMTAQENNNKLEGLVGWQAMSRPEVLGTVTAISGNIVTVKDLRGNTNTIYTVDATNATVIKNGTASTVSAILVNDTVSVQGVINGTNVTASKINNGLTPKEKENQKNRKLENENNLNNPIIIGDGSPIIAGTVATISGNTITIKNKSNVVYTVDATSAKVQTNSTATGTVSNIAVNDNIIVQGTINGTSVTASLIIDQKPNINKPEIKNQNNNSENQNKPAPKKRGIINWFKSLFGF